MATVFHSAIPAEWTLADVLAHLGDVPPERIRMNPPPGMATEQDLVEAESRWNRICELVDGVLVEKTMSSYESIIAVAIIRILSTFVDEHNLGVVLGESGALRILPEQVRVPDVSFISWARFPGGELPRTPVYEVVPDLAVEVLSPSNTAAEMERKLRDYMTAGVRLVWYVDPRSRSARAFTAEDRCVDVGADGILSGGDVLPGFELPLARLLEKLPPA